MCARLTIVEQNAMPRALQISVPEFSERSTGLLVPSGLSAESEVSLTLPGELAPTPEFGIVLRRLPSPIDQFRTWANEQDWGLPESSDNDTLARVKALPFEFAMIVVARLAAIVGRHQTDARAQVYAAQQLFEGRPGAIAHAEGLVRSRNRLLFVEQHLIRLARLLALDARDVGHEVPPSGEDLRLIRRTIIGMASLKGLDEPSRTTTGDWLPWMVQAAAYTATDPVLGDLARVKSLFADLGDRPDLRSDDFDPAAWAAEDERLTLEQQWTVAFDLVAKSGVLDEQAAAWNGALLPKTWPRSIAHQISVDPVAIEDTLIADRAWYASEFAEHRDDRRYATWDRRPFDERPLLRLSSGALLVISPRSFESWMTDGFYYRALHSARRRGCAPAFLTKFGHAVEGYAMRLIASAHPGARLPGGGVVHGDKAYVHPKHGARRSPDIAIDRWHDLVLIEVGSGRLSQPALVEGSVERDLDRKVSSKIRQLSSRIDDLLADYFEIDGVALSDVRRIWPIVVVPGRLLQQPLLWEHLDRAVGTSLTQPRVQPVTLLDLAELETLAGLIEQGTDLIEILRRKTTPIYAKRDFRRMVWEDPSMDSLARSTLVQQRANELFQAVGVTLGLTAAQFADFTAAEAESPR